VGYDRYSTLLGVEDSLRGIRFEPRPSLEAELLWQVRRKHPGPNTSGEPPRLPLAAAAVGIGAFIYLFWAYVLTLPP
jgi:hypothetical protein